MSDVKFRFKKTGGGYEVTGVGECGDADLVIPSEHGGKPVTGIGKDAFGYRSDIRSVFIPDTVERIEPDAFCYCSSLREVSGMEGVRWIEHEAFCHCHALERITIPAGCLKIGWKAFLLCSRLADVRNLSSLDLAASDSGLKAVNVYSDESGAGAYFTTGDGFRWYAFPCGDGKVRRLLAGYDGDDKDIRLPEACEGQPYDVCCGAFCGCDIESVEMPPCVRYVGADAFYDCESLREVRVRSVSDWLGIRFENEWANPFSAEGVTLSAGGEPVTNLEIPAGTEEIRDYAFAGAGYGCVEIPEGVARIEKGAFCDCLFLHSVTLPESLLTIGDDAFRGCNHLLEIINLSVLKIVPGDDGYGRVAVRAKAVKTSAGDKGTFFMDGEGYCFYDSGDGLYLFDFLGDAGSLTLPETEGRTYEICEETFADSPVTELRIPSCVTSVGPHAFLRCDVLKHVSIGDGVAYIGHNAFAGCSALEDVETGRGLIMIGPWAFFGCESLREVRFSDGLRHIGHGAFEWCPALRGIVVPGTVEHIGRGAFRTSEDDGPSLALDVFLLKDPVGIRPKPYEWREPDDPDEADCEEEGEPMTLWLYSAERPGIPGRFWHYDGAGNPVKW